MLELRASDALMNVVSKMLRGDDAMDGKLWEGELFEGIYSSKHLAVVHSNRRSVL